MMHPDNWKAGVIGETILNILLNGYVKAVKQGIAGTTIIGMIIGVIELVLCFDRSLDIGLSEMGVIHEEIHHLGGT